MEKKNKTNNRNIHKDHRIRMKETYKKFGFDAFSTVEKLEFLLFFGIPYKDTNPTAHELLDKYKTIHDIINAPYSALKDLKGMGEHSALLINCIHDLIQEYSKIDTTRLKLTGTKSAQEYCKSLFVAKPYEEMFAIFLDADGTVRNTTSLGVGTASEVEVPIKKLSKEVFNNHCTRVILSHNHPGGINRPSDEDFQFTKRALLALGIIDVDIIDHIIVAPTGTYSMRATKELELFKKDMVENDKGYQLFTERYVRQNTNLSEYKIDG